MACIIIPDVPLQIVQIRKPEWRTDPVAVVAGEGPQARISHLNARAAALGVAAGMRYAAAAAMAPHLRAAVLPANEIASLIASATRVLRAHSPEVEPSADQPGVFWVNASGLDGMYGSCARWGEAVQAGLGQLGLHGTLVIGFSRFGTYAVAASSQGTRVFQTPEEERTDALKVPLSRLHLPDEPAARLSKLGVENVGAFLRLPCEGLLRRFGREVYRLHQFASGDLWLPLQPSFEQEAPRAVVVLDPPEAGAEALLFLIKRALPTLFSTLAARGEAMAGLEIHLKPEGRHGWLRALIRPAAPTLDDVQLVDLTRLRLDRIRLAERVSEIVLVGHGASWVPDAPRLLPDHRSRDLTAGRRALARLRAALGEEAVVRARLKNGHLPEARYVWEPVEQISPARPSEHSRPTLVRRIWTRPVALHDEHDAIPAAAHAARAAVASHGAPIRRLTGPHVISGGWWVKEVHREYHFVETRDGEVLWIYFDRIRHRWFAQGRVE